MVIGAGATRGASFVDPAKLPPPLDRDFFRVLQMSQTGRTNEGRALLEHVREQYGPAMDVGMETVFSNLDAAKEFHEHVRVGGGAQARWPERRIDDFRTVLPSLLGETVGDEACSHHGALAYQLRATDAVVSLNYDCVIDRALCSPQAGNRFAAARKGYGVDAVGEVADWRGHARGRSPTGSVRLLKLHGSLNWAGADLPLQLRADEAIYEPVPEGVIQPPLTKKTVSEEPFLSIWREARRAIKGSRRLIVAGYSMPPADGLVRTLLGTDLAALEEVVVVEPNSSVQAAHVDFFARRADAARVFPFEGMRELARLLEAA